MKKTFIALLIMTILTSCFSCKSFKINVELKNSTGKTVYLNHLENGAMKTVDSIVAKDDKAVFKVKKDDNNDALHVMMQGWRRPLTFFADNQDVTITGDYQNYKEIVVKASTTQQNLDAFFAKLDQIEDEKEIYYDVADYAKSNIDNQIGTYVLYRYKWAVPLEDLATLYETIPADLQSSYKEMLFDYIMGLKKTQPGMPYVDFKQHGLYDEAFALGELVDNSEVVILDFWASWCPDCRKANPELVEIYNQFKDKGLDIMSVSLDTDPYAWKNAISDDKLTWKWHVSDLQGWNNEVAQLYMVSFIPQNIVIDKKGIIIARNMPFDEMKAMLSDYLK